MCARGIAIDNHRRFFFVGVAVNSSLEEADNSYVAFDDETSGKGELYMVGWVLEVELCSMQWPGERGRRYITPNISRQDNSRPGYLQSGVIEISLGVHLQLLWIRYAKHTVFDVSDLPRSCTNHCGVAGSCTEVDTESPAPSQEKGSDVG